MADSQVAHAHPAGLAHQFEDLKQQHEAGTLGMWAFLITEILFFGGLFAGYFIYRTKFPAAWQEASHHLDVFLGGFNTAVLIGSSLTMAMAVDSARTDKRKAFAVFMLLTMALGAVFLGVKVVEYSHKFHDNLFPGVNFHWEGPNARQVQLFYVFYFAMTGMHALHMIIGLGLMSVILYMGMKGRFTPQHFAPVEISGLYWHFVDIVWIFLFPLLYLIGFHVK